MCISEDHILYWWLSQCVCMCVRLSNSWPCLSFSWLVAVFARCHLGVWPQIKPYLTVIIVCMWVTQWPRSRVQNQAVCVCVCVCVCVLCVCVYSIRTASFPSSLPFSVFSPMPCMICYMAIRIHSVNIIKRKLKRHSLLQLFCGSVHSLSCEVNRTISRLV